jgi:hypothetical protein
VLGHRDQQLGPTDRLRYRSMTGAGRRPEGTEPSTRMRALPLALWPDWSIRLRPPTLDHPKRFRIAAAIALCLPGATVPLGSIRDRWPGPNYKQRMTLFARFITADPHGTAILAALCALADSLDQHGAMIDYARRRALASQIALLDRDAWTVMCRAGGIAMGAECKLAHARLWLWETITGGLPQQAPAALRPGYRECLSHHNRFALRLPAPTVRRLSDHARQLLDTHGCAHEPLTWSPGGQGIQLDQLPGRDPTHSTRSSSTRHSRKENRQPRPRKRSASRSSISTTSHANTRPNQQNTRLPPEPGSPPSSPKNNYANSSTRVTRCTRSRSGTTSTAGPSATNSPPTASRSRQPRDAVAANRGSHRHHPVSNYPRPPHVADAPTVQLSPDAVSTFDQFLQAAGIVARHRRRRAPPPSRVEQYR